jgi:hypothetical protein
MKTTMGTIALAITTDELRAIYEVLEECFEYSDGDEDYRNGLNKIEKLLGEDLTEFDDED